MQSLSSTASLRSVEQKDIDIIFLLDESGSMMTMGDEPLQALNKFISDQKKVPGKISIVTFNNEVHEKVTSQYISTFPEFTDYHPNGMTALYDAIGRSISTKLLLGVSPYQKGGQRTTDVQLVIITDGEDNSSKEYTSSSVSQLLKTVQEKNNWKVVFLGANIDSKKECMAMGIPVSCSFNQNQKGNLAGAVKVMSAKMVSDRERMSQLGT